MKHIDINVVGTTASGKTTICAIINQALEEHGIAATVNLLDGEHVDNPNITSRIGVRASAIASNDVKITVNEVQAMVKHSAANCKN
jgi:uridine kinase